MGRPAQSVEPERQAKPLASSETVEQVQPARSFFVELAEILLLAVGLYIVITFAIQTVHVIGFSMVPTLNDHDSVLATKIDLRFATPARGDIVILKDPFDNSQVFVKRVIALPGERLKITRGSVFINGRQLQEPYLPTGLKTADYPA